MLVEANRIRVFSLVLLTASALASAFMGCSDDEASPNPIPGVDSGIPPGNPADSAAPNEGWSLTIQEEVLAKTQSPLGALPPSPGNKYADDAAAAALGQQFFFEKAIAGPITQVPNDLGAANETGKVSCASCHVMPWGSDTR